MIIHTQRECPTIFGFMKANQKTPEVLYINVNLFVNRVGFRTDVSKSKPKFVNKIFFSLPYRVPEKEARQFGHNYLRTEQ